MEIQDMDYEINELGGKLRRDVEVYSDDDDHPDGPD